MSRSQGFVILLVLVAIILGVSALGYQDELDEQAVYCARVAAGDWPDYKGLRAAGECR